jgi:TPR repeat protein
MGIHKQLNEEDRTALFNLLRRARGGDVNVLSFLASLYKRGAVEIQKSLPRARTFALRAARLGDVDSQLMLADMLDDEGRREESFDWFYKAAEGGSMRAQLMLCEHYMAGAVVDANEDQALYWLDRAAENAQTQNDLDGVAHTREFFPVRVEFSGKEGSVSRVVPMRRRTFWRMEKFESPFFDDMFADLREFMARHPVVGMEYLEAMRWLKKQKVMWQLSAVALLGVQETDEVCEAR